MTLPTESLDAIEAKRALTNMAEILASYIGDLTKEGFSRSEALQIVIAWQAAALVYRTPDSD